MYFIIGHTEFILMYAPGALQFIWKWVLKWNSLEKIWPKIRYFYSLKLIFIALDLHYNVSLLEKKEGMFIRVRATIRINIVHFAWFMIVVLQGFALNLENAKQNLLQMTFYFLGVFLLPVLFFGENKSWHFIWSVC